MTFLYLELIKTSPGSASSGLVKFAGLMASPFQSITFIFILDLSYKN